MPESVRITLAPARTMIIPFAIGSLIALLVINAIGTIFGLAMWPVLGIVYRQANRALGAATFTVNLITAVLSYFIVSWLARVGEREESQQQFPTLLRHNVPFLNIARVATLFACIETIFAFVRHEASNFVIIQVGNATQIDFLRGTWAVALGFVLPVALLFLLLAGTAKLQAAQAPGA